MKILLIADQFYRANNGMTISARRFAEVLERHGNEVRVLSYGTPEDVAPGKTAYLMKKKYIPVFDKLVSSQGMTFAKVDKRIISEAVHWADVVHLLTPFAVSHNAVKLARREGIPCTAAFHVQPENISSSIHLGNCRFINNLIYHWFRLYIYRYTDRIHCPSNFIANELKKHGYKSELHVISNGIDSDFKYNKLPKTPEFDGKFVILSTGRLSIEKRQDVTVDAVALSRHRKEIKLVLAGNGPRKKQILSRAEKCGVDVYNNFFSKSELLNMIAMSDLYVHSADIEIEAMSCMEAFAGGLVPIIADSPRSATPQFALDDRSLFPAGDPAALAKKIDYWIEHPDIRRETEMRYAELGLKYALDSCVSAAEKMFGDEISAHGKTI